MRRRAALIVLAMVAATWPLGSAQPPSGRLATGVDEGRKHVQRFSVDSTPRIDALMNLACQHGVPLGIEYAGPELFAPVTLDLADTDIAQVMTSLFPTTAGFSLSLNGDVPVIRHRTLPPPNRNALDVVLPRVFIQQRTSMQRAASQVWMAWAVQLDPTIGGFAGSDIGMPEPRIPPLDLTEVTARDALNRLAREDGHAVWFVTVSPEQLDRSWKKTDPSMWSTMQYDYGSPEDVGRLLRSRLPDITPPAGRGAAADEPRVRVGSTFFTPRKVKHVNPVYPAALLATRIQGMVIVELRIDKDGHVADARVLRSNPPLDEAALEAVRQWRYEPLLFNGAPTGLVLSVIVDVSPPPTRAR